jgi:hypothetical protein
LAIGHDDAIGPPLVGSEWIAMRILVRGRSEMRQKLRGVFQLAGSDQSN